MWGRSEGEVPVGVTPPTSLLSTLCACSELIMKHEVRIHVLGDLELLPADVLESVARAVNFSKNNNRLVHTILLLCSLFLLSLRSTFLILAILSSPSLLSFFLLCGHFIPLILMVWSFCHPYPYLMIWSFRAPHPFTLCGHFIPLSFYLIWSFCSLILIHYMVVFFPLSSPPPLTSGPF